MPEDHSTAVRDGTPRRVAVGVDVGGTKVLGVLVALDDPEGPQILERLQVPVATGASGEPEELASQVSEVAELLLAAHGRRVPVGIGVAGYVDLDGAVLRSPNVPQAVGADLVGAVRSRTGIDPLVDNDANCVATAALFWRRPRVTDLVAITFGTGIGGGLVVGGRLLRGANGFAGEPGHMVVVPNGVQCVCGQRGCWERYASGSALRALAEEAFATGRVTRPPPTGDHLGSGEALIDAARVGDGAAKAVLSEYAQNVARGLANLVNLLDPGLIVVSGGVARALDVMFDDIVGALDSNPTVGHRMPSIEVAPFAEAAGALGAATAAAAAAPNSVGEPGLWRER